MKQISEKKQKKIKELLREGWGKKRIGKKVGIDPKSVTNYQKKFEEEAEEKRLHRRVTFEKKSELQDGGESQEGKVTTEKKEEIKVEKEVHFDSATDMAQDLIKGMEDISKKKKRSVADQKEFDRRLNALRGMVREEVDERIPREREEAVDKWWTEHEGDYVTKEDFEEKERDIATRDDRIKELEKQLRSTAEGLTETIGNLRSEGDNLKRSNIELAERNGDLSDYIGLHIDDERERLRLWAKSLENRETSLGNNKVSFEDYKKRQRANLDKMFLDAKDKMKKSEEREELVEKREKQAEETEERLVKIIDGIEENKKRQKREWDDLEKAVKERKQYLQDWEIRLEKTEGFNKFSRVCSFCEKAMFFDTTNEEIDKKLDEVFGKYMHPECIKQQQQKISSGKVKLIPIEEKFINLINQDKAFLKFAWCFLFFACSVFSIVILLKVNFFI